MPNVNYSNALTSIRQATQEAETTEEFRYSDSLLDMSTILATVAVHLGRAVSETPQTTALSRSSALASSVITQHTTYGIAFELSDIRAFRLTPTTSPTPSTAARRSSAPARTSSSRSTRRPTSPSAR